MQKLYMFQQSSCLVLFYHNCSKKLSELTSNSDIAIMDLPSVIVSEILSFINKDEWSNAIPAIPKSTRQSSEVRKLIRNELQAIKGIKHGIQVKNPIKGFAIERAGKLELIEWVDCIVVRVYQEKGNEMMEFYMPNLHVSKLLDEEIDDINLTVGSCDLAIGLGSQWRFHPHDNEYTCHWCFTDTVLSLFYVC